ncbi:MAG: hypothetical protein KOO63_07485 [Bacteroidales bacterium]|nr:hypothetical protein [Candidatus Latescibacterota bacterium]
MKMKTCMDKHLNIFQAYHGGNLDSPERVNRLEDNLTRAFIICLKFLQDAGVLRPFFEKIGFAGGHIPKTLVFDLQNMKDKKALGRIQASNNQEHQWLLLIGRDQFKSHWRDDAARQVEKVMEILADTQGSEKRKDFLKYLREIGKREGSTKNFDLNFPEIDPCEAASFFSLIHGCRPDAWIYEEDSNSPFAILVESKVGANKLAHAQVFRHLTGDQGFNLSSDKAIKFIHDKSHMKSTTWTQIAAALKSLMSQLEKTPEVKTIITQFLEYLEMSGEILNLRKLNDVFDEDYAKGQFALFLDVLDRALFIRNGSANKTQVLSRGKRPLAGLWDFYGLENNGKILQNPHISIYLNHDGIGCGITVAKKGPKMRNLLKTPKMVKFLMGEMQSGGVNRQRVKINLVNYRLVDRKPGQVKGDYYDSFRFCVDLKELKGLGKDPLETVDNLVGNCIPISKQLEVLFHCAWVDASKANISLERGETLRRGNLELFENPDQLVNAFINFIEEMIPVLVDVQGK